MILLGAATSGACSSHSHPTAPTTYQDSWADSPNRPWPGKDWYANRIQDWQVRDGRLECLTNQDSTAGRTVHLLAHEIDSAYSPKISLGVNIEPINAGPLKEKACAGVLLGVGDEKSDPRARAMVQQVPAPGGGWLASINSQGKMSIRDFSQNHTKAGSWTLPSNLDFRELPLLAEAKETIPPEAWPIRLEIEYSKGVLSLAAIHKTERIATLFLSEVPEEKINGGVALFSARGSKKGAQGFAFSSFNISGTKATPKNTFGPILGALYLVATDMRGERALRFSAQMPDMGKSYQPLIKLQLGNRPPMPGSLATDGSWTVNWVFHEWEEHQTIPWTLLLDGEKVLNGSIRGEPTPKTDWSIATLSCVKHQVGRVSWNRMGLWFPHADLVEHLMLQDPDLLYFAGDQLYEGDITGPDRRSTEISIQDYHTKWQRFLWSFGSLTLDRPTIIVPDDHDVFHGNLWGAGGIRAIGGKGLRDQDAGGYRMPASFVNVVHRTQTGHLPPTQVSPVIGDGITTWSTAFSWGGVDFCVISDRMWKSSPTMAVPEGQFRNGWAQKDGFNPKEADVPGAHLLGEEQEALLAHWGTQTSKRNWTKMVLSQSPFACLHTLPGKPKSDNGIPSLVVPKPGEMPPDDSPVMDGDSNGWPQTARRKAVDLLAQADALHLTGDQHLGSVAWYGSQHFRDGTVAFTTPAMANTFPRRWMPSQEGGNRRPKSPTWTGDFHDGFGNKVTVLAVANPIDEGRKPELLFNRAPGYGIVRLNPSKHTVRLEAWPRWANPKNPDEMFPGWPVLLGPNGRPQPE
ncbi:MAG TPA: hypothetical protein DDW23_05690 [Planctomycetes bacterium]|nr:hypothetical protein [Planctomycetota bacterium]